MLLGAVELAALHAGAVIGSIALRNRTCSHVTSGPLDRTEQSNPLCPTGPLLRAEMEAIESQLTYTLGVVRFGRLNSIRIKDVKSLR